MVCRSKRMGDIPSCKQVGGPSQRPALSATGHGQGQSPLPAMPVKFAMLAPMGVPRIAAMRKRAATFARGSTSFADGRAIPAWYAATP